MKKSVKNSNRARSRRSTISISSLASKNIKAKSIHNRISKNLDFGAAGVDHYQRTWETASDALCLADKQGIVLDVNPAYCQLFGYRRDEVIGKSLRFIFPDQTHSQVIEQYQSLFRSDSNPPLIETRICRKDGAERIVESQFDFIVVEGERRAMLSVTRDITARKRTEDQVKNQLRGLASLNSLANVIINSSDTQQLLEASLDIALHMTNLKVGLVHLLDEDSSVRKMIAQRGLSPQWLDEIAKIHLAWNGSPNVPLIGESIIEGIATDLGLDFSPEQRYSFVAIPIRTKSKLLGELILVGGGVHPVNETDKSLLATVGYQLGVAIENFRLMEKTAEIKALRELDRLRSELVANVSHELRTPLGLIKVFCTTLMAKDVAFDRPTRLEFLADIDRETDKLEGIVSNLLDLSRLQSNRFRLDKLALDLGELITTVIDDMKINFSQHQVTYDLPVEPLSVMADPQRIEQVLRNLIGNAVKYSPGGGSIIIQCRKEARQIVVSVSDEGIGIPTEDLERIFERFYRVDNEITRRVGGVGLGLSLSRGIIEEHGGRIWAESSNGRGTTFYFALPEMDSPKSDLD